jgi:endo-1,4-beta-mannosidase
MSFELGCNYWPRKSAMYMWRALDLGEVRDELAHVRELGFEVVRFFVLATDFMPAPLTVAAPAVDALVQVARIAREVGLRTVPTLIVINMSGMLWWPRWMLDAEGKPGDLYGDPLILRSQALLVETCCRALAGDASIRAFDLANEIDGAQKPASRHAGWLWSSLLAGAARRAAPAVPIQIGAHLPSLTDDNRMRVDDLGQVADEDCMHAYPLYYPGARSPLDPELAPFAASLTAALAGTGRPALMHEFGLCTAEPGAPGRTIEDDFLGRARRQYLASEVEAGRYYAEVLERLAATGAAGAYAWCYADYDASLFDRAPLDRAVRERTFGVVRADGSEKPAAVAVRAFAKRLAKGEARLDAGPRVLDVSADAYYAAPDDHFRRLYASWLRARGERAERAT